MRRDMSQVARLAPGTVWFGAPGRNAWSRRPGAGCVCIPCVTAFCARGRIRRFAPARQGTCREEGRTCGRMPGTRWARAFCPERHRPVPGPEGPLARKSERVEEVLKKKVQRCRMLRLCPGSPRMSGPDFGRARLFCRGGTRQAPVLSGTSIWHIYGTYMAHGSAFDRTCGFCPHDQVPSTPPRPPKGKAAAKITLQSPPKLFASVSSTGFSPAGDH